MLWRKLTAVLVERFLRFQPNAKIIVENSGGAAPTEISLAELVALNDLSATDLQKIDGITNGTPAASKALVLDANKNTAPFSADRIYGTQAAPETATDTATLTSAQMLSGILVATPTAAAAYTTLTGALLDDAVEAVMTLRVGMTFDLTIINIGGTADDITYTAGASGFSIVGDAVVRPSADSGTEQAGQGTFRHRRTAADTWVAYRIA